MIEDAEIITVRPDNSSDTQQGLPYFFGISEHTANSKGLSMSRVSIPPSGKSQPHYHCGYETAIYVVQGRVETIYGLNLERSVINQAGDFIYIPEGLPHQAINLSYSETAIAIVARNDANEQEKVMPYCIVA